MPDKYSQFSEMAKFGFLANAYDRGKGEDGDTGASFPRSDAEDMTRGARFIPSEVTLARRRGEKVSFVAECSPNCWYWELPNGERRYHYDSTTYFSIGRANGRTASESEHGSIRFPNGAGPCPACGNPHTEGGKVSSAA